MASNGYGKLRTGWTEPLPFKCLCAVSLVNIGQKMADYGDKKHKMSLKVGERVENKAIMA